jgi:hypothetical protein
MIRTQEVDAALAQFTEMMATDGYLLGWEQSGDDRIVVRIDATPEACADCLVPQPVMHAILASALDGTSYTLERVDLPGGH